MSISDTPFFTEDYGYGLLAITSLSAAVLALILFLLSYSQTRKSLNQEKIRNKNLEERKEHLSRELKLFTEMIDKLGFPIWYRNDDLSLKYYNLSYSLILENNRQANKLAEEVLKIGISQSLNNHVIISGERRLYKITESPLFYDGKQGTVGFAIDISELEKSENELKHHEKFESSLIQSSSSAIAIYGKDTRLDLYNQAFVDLWKLDEKWLNTKPTYGELLEILREKRKLPEQINFLSFKKDNLALFTNLLEKKDEYYYLPDGRVIFVVVIPHENGGLLFSYDDKTEQIALERSYNTLVSVYKSTLDNLYEGVAVFGEDGRLQICNPKYAEIWDLDQSFLKSEPHFSDILDKIKLLFMTQEDWGRYKERIISIISRRKPAKEILKKIDNSVFSVAFEPLPNASTLVTYTNITDSMRVESSLRAEKKALEEADRIKTNFLANVSYELRSPLTSIKGFSELMLGKLADLGLQKQKEYINYIHDSSLKLASMIDNIIDAASINAGHMKLDMDWFEIDDMLSDVEKEVSEKFSASSLNFIMNAPGSMGRMYSDRKRIIQIITRLLSDCIRSANRGEEISISVKIPQNSEIVFSIGKENREANNYNNISNKNALESLDFTIAKSLAELHGGKIEFYKGETGSILYVLTLKRDSRYLYN